MVGLTRHLFKSFLFINKLFKYLLVEFSMFFKVRAKIVEVHEGGQIDRNTNSRVYYNT